MSVYLRIIPFLYLHCELFWVLLSDILAFSYFQTTSFEHFPVLLVSCSVQHFFTQYHSKQFLSLSESFYEFTLRFFLFRLSFLTAVSNTSTHIKYIHRETANKFIRFLLCLRIQLLLLLLKRNCSVKVGIVDLKYYKTKI